MKVYYHFVGEKLRDGRPVPNDGEWLVHKGSLVMCESGLHASPSPFEALQYAPGAVLCEVELAGKIIKDDDKVVAHKRKIIRRVDLTEVCRKFAREEALKVAHLWEIDKHPPCREYLETGKEELRAAARDAALDAVRAAGDAAWDAARAAARAAARDAAWDAAWTAGDAAWAAAWAAARHAAWAAAGAASAKRFNKLALKVLCKP